MISRRLVIAVVLLAVAVLVLGFQVYRIFGRAKEITPAADNRPIAPPVSGPPTAVALFLASDSDGTLHRTNTTIALPAEPSKRAKEVLRALVAQYQEQSATHSLGAGADIDDVYLVNDTLAVVDANAVFAEGHRSGILVEELTLASMAQTLAANLPGITRMKLLIGGKERATLAGHADLTQPYDVARASAMVK